MEKINFQDLPSTSTPLNSTNLNQMQDNMEDAIIPIKLVTISESAPSSATTGDMYYNTTDNKVYTATGTNTWDTGTTPRYDGFYINTSDNTLFYYNGSTLIGVGGSSSEGERDTTPIGVVSQYAGTTAPDNYLLCDGQEISRTTYSQLFEVIGTSYGNGDGSTTFNVPNIQGRFPIGISSSDTDFNTLGKTGGSKTHKQTIEELAKHHHTQNLGGELSTVANVPGDYIIGKMNTSNTYDTGESKPMDIMNPYIVMNYIIKAL